MIRTPRDPLTLLLLALLAGCATPAAPAESETMRGATVLFLCPRGGAKSVMAASYFNLLAKEQSLPYVGIAAAAEEPYDAVPSAVADFLEREGIDVRAFKPRQVELNDLRNAERVISIDCNLDGGNVSTPVERWEVTKVSVDLDAVAAAIRQHVDMLAAELRDRD